MSFHSGSQEGPEGKLRIFIFLYGFVHLFIKIIQNLSRILKLVSHASSSMKIKAFKSWYSPNWEQKQDLRTPIESKYAI